MKVPKLFIITYMKGDEEDTLEVSAYSEEQAVFLCAEKDIIYIERAVEKYKETA